MTAFARRIFSFDEQRQLPQGLAKSRTGEDSKEENLEAINTDIEDEKLNGVTGALAAPSDEAPAETPSMASIKVQGVASTKVRGENSEVEEAMENFKGCEWTERHFHGGADESIEVMNGKVNFEGISGDSSTGATKFGNDQNSHQMIMMIIMMMQMYLIAMQATCRSVEVSTFAEENDLKKTSMNHKHPQAKLKLKRGITMDSGAGNNVMPRRMVIRKSDIRESEGSKNGVHYVAANNGRIPNEGEYDLQFNTIEGNEQRLTFQIAEVNKALCAVSNLVDQGYRVVFDQDAKTGQDTSYMMQKDTGVTTRFRRTRNVWVLDAFVDSTNNSNSQSFHRRG